MKNVGWELTARRSDIAGKLCPSNGRLRDLGERRRLDRGVRPSLWRGRIGSAEERPLSGARSRPCAGFLALRCARICEEPRGDLQFDQRAVYQIVAVLSQRRLRNAAGRKARAMAGRRNAVRCERDTRDRRRESGHRRRVEFPTIFHTGCGTSRPIPATQSPPACTSTSTISAAKIPLAGRTSSAPYRTRGIRSSSTSLGRPAARTRRSTG